MARLRMTYKNLKALRKTKEYQALLVDLVANNIVPKSVAENLLGYNIPANLIGGAEQGSGSGNDNPVVEPTNTVTLLYFRPGNREPDEWLTAEYDLTDDPTGEGILTFAQDAFSDDNINFWVVVEEDPEYVEGEDGFSDKYIESNPQPETIESGMLIKVFIKHENN